MKPVIQATVCYPRLQFKRVNEPPVYEILLGLHKDTPSSRKIGHANKITGPGGKFEEGVDKTLRHCAQRETFEEYGITPILDCMCLAAELAFERPDKIMYVSFYFANVWQGEPRETDAFSYIKPYPIKNLPWRDMMDSDQRLLLPLTIHSAFTRGEVMRGTVLIGPENVMRSAVLRFDKASAPVAPPQLVTS